VQKMWKSSDPRGPRPHHPSTRPRRAALTPHSTRKSPKSGVDRSTIRLGVGQLLDYLRLVPGIKGSLLLPSKPSSDLMTFIDTCGLGLTYLDGTEWTAVPSSCAAPAGSA
jgi:hypothetical protein